MSIIAISSRLLRPRANIFYIRNLNHERPTLRFRDPESLISNIKVDYDEHEYKNLNEPVGALGYILLSVPVISFILGSWQIERRKWKLSVIEDLTARLSLPPQSLPEDLTKLEEMNYCPVKVRGTFLYDREFAIGPKIRITDKPGSPEGGSLLSTQGRNGFHVITPFKVDDRDLTILVNRGWIPSKLEKLSKEKLGHVPGVVEITGNVRLSEKRQGLTPRNMPTAGVWIYRDVETMARMAGTDPVFLDLCTNSQVPNGPIAGQTRVKLRNEHLAYIFTWYSLSIVTSWMWYRLFIKKLPLL